MKPTPDELQVLLHKHKLFLDNKPGGVKADLSEKDLSWVDFRGANLSEVCFRDADLTGACLRGACLRGACFHNANLRWTDLCEIDLSTTCLTGAKNQDSMFRDTP